MSSVKMLERECFENLFGMDSGYVIKFTNPTFRDFFRENACVDI